MIIDQEKPARAHARGAHHALRHRRALTFVDQRESAARPKSCRRGRAATPGAEAVLEP